MSQPPGPRTPTPEMEIHFRDQLRAARATALSDAEGYRDLIQCIERFGYALTETHDRHDGLGKYKDVIVPVAARSPLAEDIPTRYGDLHLSFSALYESVRTGRNDAFHQGAAARHLTTHAIELSLILEDALMTDRDKVRDFMVRDPVCAYPWQPISFIRQTLLMNSFSYLPVCLDQAKAPWHLVSDWAVAAYLRRHANGKERPEALACPLECAISSGEIVPVRARVVGADKPVQEVFQKSDGLPVLVCRARTRDLLGILTPFDLL